MTDISLGYRSFFLVRPEEEASAEAVAFSQFHSWLRSKKYDVDALREDSEVDIAAGVVARLIRLDGQDGSTTLQARVVERPLNGQTWESELTVHTPGRTDADASVLLDISGPFRPKTPRLARMLTESLPARDSRAMLRDKPFRVGAEGVEALGEAVCDPQRRGLIFISGMSDELPVDGWYEYVTNVLKETTGLAASYFLDSEATQAFADMMGETHAVGPGTVRTFLPDTDPASSIDALRHRILGTDRILRDSGHRLSHVLGRRAQEETLQAELPTKMRRLERQLVARADELLVLGITTPSTPSEIPSSVSDRDLHDVVKAEQESFEPELEVDVHETPAPETDSKGPVARWLERARTAVRRVLGVDDPEVADWERLTELALIGKNASTVQQGVSDQLARLRDALDSQRDEQQELMQRLSDEQLEHAATAETLEELSRRNVYLEDLVRKTELVSELYGDAGQEPDQQPADFEALLTMLDDLEYVEFTGDEDITLALDQQDPLGNWAGKAWRVLRALDDYARASSAGGTFGGMHGYLQDTPSGCCGYSVNKHATTESEDVQNNGRFLGARVFPVPTSVSPEGKVAMLAHFKIAQSGLVSPRLHYYDATAVAGKIFVGHIGPHLPTKRTN